MRAAMPPVTKSMSSSVEEDSEVRRGPWTLEEDTLLTHYIARHGEGRWNMLAKCAGLKRTGKSCRLRWLNYLKPDIKRGNLTPQEQLLILELHSKWGNRWSKIAQHLPGRTDNEIKNYWRTRVQKQARQLNIESNSKKFVDAVRCFWMPRLLQKVEQTSSSSCLSEITSGPDSEPKSLPTFSQLSTKITDINSNYYSFENSNTVSSQNYYYIPEFMNSSEQIEIPHHLTSSPNVFGYTCVYNNDQIQGENYNPQSPNAGYFATDDFSLASISGVGSYEGSPSDCQMGVGNWMSNEMTDTLWNMDDIWQFRELGEMGN